jgi:hypothetical protein
MIVKEAISILQGAAQCDGAHHKQYDIIRALKLLMGPNDYASWKQELECEDSFIDEGIP